MTYTNMHSLFVSGITQKLLNWLLYILWRDGSWPKEEPSKCWYLDQGADQGFCFHFLSHHFTTFSLISLRIIHGSWRKKYFFFRGLIFMSVQFGADPNKNPDLFNLNVLLTQTVGPWRRKTGFILFYITQPCSADVNWEKKVNLCTFFFLFKLIRKHWLLDTSERKLRTVGSFAVNVAAIEGWSSSGGFSKIRRKAQKDREPLTLFPSHSGCPAKGISLSVFTGKEETRQKTSWMRVIDIAGQRELKSGALTIQLYSTNQ